MYGGFNFLLKATHTCMRVAYLYNLRNFDESVHIVHILSCIKIELPYQLLFLSRCKMAQKLYHIYPFYTAF